MAEETHVREGPHQEIDYLASLALLRKMRQSMRYDAVIKSQSTEPNQQDEFVVDIYTQGIKFDNLGNIVGEPDLPDVRAFVFNTSIPPYKAGRLLKVRLVENMAFILPQEIPEDLGFGKVLMIVDDFGSWWADYPRFNSAFIPAEEIEEDETTSP